MSTLLIAGPFLALFLHERHPVLAAGFVTPSLAYIVLVCATLIAEKVKRRPWVVVAALGLMLFVLGVKLEQYFFFKAFTAGVSLAFAALAIVQARDPRFDFV